MFSSLHSAAAAVLVGGVLVQITSRGCVGEGRAASSAQRGLSISRLGSNLTTAVVEK